MAYSGDASVERSPNTRRGYPYPDSRVLCVRTLLGL